MSSAKALPVQVLKVARVFLVAFALLMFLAMTPAPAHAAGLTTEQKQAVINLLSSFGADQATLNNVSLSLNGGSREDILNALGNKPMGSNEGQGGWQNMPGASGCALLQRTLNRGHVGDDVRQLQEFLRKMGDLKVDATTDFFGPATERALQAWQAREGIVANGDAQSTGFGAVGPKTRMMIMMRCKDAMGGQQNGNGNGDNGNQGGPWGTAGTTSPICILKANKNSIRPGESVVLAWESKNATYASSVTGEQGPVSGSITLSPTQTTTYLKRVYNATTQGECMTTVTVGTTTPLTEKKVVVVPAILNIGRTVALMGSGMAAVMDGYLSLFGMSLE